MSEQFLCQIPGRQLTSTWSEELSREFVDKRKHTSIKMQIKNISKFYARIHSKIWKHGEMLFLLKIGKIFMLVKGVLKGVSFSKSPLLFNIIQPFLCNKLKTFCNTVHLNFTYIFWFILKIKKNVKYQLVGNRIGGVLASMLSPSEAD